MKRFAIQMRLLSFLLLEAMVDWALLTTSTIYFITMNLGETLSSKTRTLFSSNFPVTWCKSARIVNSWDSDQNYLTGIETHWQISTSNFWLTIRREQTIDYVFVQTLEPFPQSFISRTGSNNQSFRTMNSQNLPTILLQVFQWFSHKCNKLFFHFYPIDFIRFLYECIVNLFKRNLQSIIRHHVTKFENEVLLPFLKRISFDLFSSKIATSHTQNSTEKNIIIPFLAQSCWHPIFQTVSQKVHFQSQFILF